MSELKPIDQTEVENFQDILKRCPDGTLDALLRYRSGGDLDALNLFLMGCIKRHTDEELHVSLNSNDQNVSFIDDLGVDSMTMMELVMMVEECLSIRLDNRELMEIQTIGDLNEYIKKLV